MKKIFIFTQFLILFIATATIAFAQPDIGDDEQVIQEAADLFEEQKYLEAYPLYSQLLSLHRKDPFYSYRFGVCMLYSDRRDSEKPLKYMETGVGELEGEDAKMVYFHLGVAYHQAYRFGEAIRAFETFKTRINQKHQYFYDTEIRLQMCLNGIALLKDISELYVLKKYEVGYEQFFRSYNLNRFGGNLTPKPEFLKTKLDRKSDEKQLVFFSDTHNVVYYSSLGRKKKGGGKDIYRVYKKGNNVWSDPEKLSSTVNTKFDEDFPYLLPDGRTLYFCSKGHNTMGGYDIFKTVFDSVKNDWTEPENIDFAINTPFDDILFITDPSQRYAWFSSFRNSSDGRIMVYLVRIDKRPIDIEKLNTDLIASKEIDFENPDYLKTIEYIRSKAALDVNTDEEMEIDSVDANALANAEDNLRYNIPANPSDTDIVDITFNYVNSAEKEMFVFRELRDASLNYSENKKNDAIAENKKSSELYDQALLETDLKERQKLMTQAVNSSKSSEELMEESDIAKQMYLQYEEGAKEQKKVMEFLQLQAGYIQQFAGSQQIDTSVVLLKRLIDDIDTFKIEIAQTTRKIQGDREYLNELQSDIVDKKAEIIDLGEKANRLEQEAEQYRNEAALTNNDELKQDYLDEALALRTEAENIRQNINEMKGEIDDDEKTLNELLANVETRQNVGNQILELSANNANNDIAVNNNSNNTNNDVNNNANNDVNNNANNDVNNNANNQNNNNADTNNTNANIQNKDIMFRDQVNDLLDSKLDSLEIEKNKVDMQSDALALMYSQKNSLYKSKLKEWTNKKDELGATPDSDGIKSLQSIQASTEDLFNQLSILSTMYADKLQEQKIFDDLISSLETIKEETSSFPEKSDSSIVYAQLDKSNKLISSVQNSDKEISVLKMQIVDVEAILMQTENELAELQTEENKLSEQIRDIEEKIAKTRNDKKKEKLNGEKHALDIELDVILSKIEEKEIKQVLFSDSLAYLEKKDEYQNQFTMSVQNLSENDLSDMSNEWKYLNNISENDLLIGPDFIEKDQLIAWNSSVSNDISNTTTNNQNNNSNNNTLDNQNTNGNYDPTLIYSTDNNPQDLSIFENIATYQDLIQASYYDMGAQAFMLRIASIKKLQARYPEKSDEYQQEIDVLTNTMRAYIAESDAYRRNGENNLLLNSKPIPDTLMLIQPENMVAWHLQEYENKLMRADSLQKLAINTDNENERRNYESQADLLNDAARMHYLAGNDIYGVWNNAKYESNNVLISEDGNNDQLVMTDASTLIIQARRIRSEAFNENDFENKQDLLNQARKLELQAIDLQNQALAEKGINDPKKMITVSVSELENSVLMNMADISTEYLNNKTLLDDYTSDLAANNDVNNNANNDVNNNANNDVNNNANNDVNNNANNDVNNNANNDVNNNVSNNQVDNTLNLYYRVQIAASRRAVDTNIYFTNVPALIEEQNAAWYKYMTGYFTDFNTANTERIRVKPMGYPDAFIVAYYNGKRVPVYEARRLEANGGANIAAANNAANTNAVNLQLENHSINDVDGLVYSVQVGVYATTRNTDRLFGITPLIEELMANGYYRYYSGVYIDYNQAITSRNQIRTLGVPDAFVVILYQGKKITRAEADRLKAEGVDFGGKLKVEEESRMIPDRTNATASKPVFMIQIGAFANDAPRKEIDDLIELAAQDVNTVSLNDLTLYTIGSYEEYADALEKRNELADRIPDAFVIAFMNGEKISINEAINITE